MAGAALDVDRSGPSRVPLGKLSLAPFHSVRALETFSRLSVEGTQYRGADVCYCTLFFPELSNAAFMRSAVEPLEP
jgi:hypothetical protein